MQQEVIQTDYVSELYQTKKKGPQVAFCLSSVKFCNYVFGIKKMFSVYFLYHFGSRGILFHSEVFL